MLEHHVQQAQVMGERERNSKNIASNALFNIPVLLLAVGPLWRPAKQEA